ncbi:MAG: hypothetical protein Q8P30_00480 [Candidatus Uhrbacteria bacterium]|nr:hypothetical protein [Candidatus Uhrbacteria bacterium]
MKLEYKTQDVRNPLDVLRKAGYSPFRDPNTNEDSFILRLTSGFYPRMHMYLQDKGDTIIFNLHLDQKKASYQGTSAHAGEYDGPTVEREATRVAGWVRSVAGAEPLNPIQNSQGRTATTGTPDQILTTNPPVHKEVPTEDTSVKKDNNKLFGGIF